MRQGRSLAVFTMLVGAALAVTTLAQGQAKPPVTVALVAAMSGGSALSGEAIKRGLTIAIDEINARGGVLGGRKLELVTFVPLYGRNAISLFDIFEIQTGGDGRDAGVEWGTLA